MSGLYFECPKKQIYMDGSVWTKSKFLGMSVGVSLIGKRKNYTNISNCTFKVHLYLVL